MGHHGSLSDKRNVQLPKDHKGSHHATAGTKKTGDEMTQLMYIILRAGISLAAPSKTSLCVGGAVIKDAKR